MWNTHVQISPTLQGFSVTELGKTLKRVYKLQEEITVFLEVKDQVFLRLSYKNWKTELAFVVESKVIKVISM